MKNYESQFSTLHSIKFNTCMARAFNCRLKPIPGGLLIEISSSFCCLQSLEHGENKNTLQQFYCVSFREEVELYHCTMW